ncbi:MAG: hypothetical protein PHW46_05600, partial [Candidatus Omnitrophica bacterium]|nr:hypothetical protein [Candidatus Omnitrophota bacterium]
HARTAEVNNSPQEADIKHIYENSPQLYEKMQEKAKQDRQNKHITEIKHQIQKYYNLAVTLERNGKYADAAECYKKISALGDDPIFKAYLTNTGYLIKQETEINTPAAAQQASKGKINEQQKSIKMQLLGDIQNIRSKVKTASR